MFVIIAITLVATLLYYLIHVNYQYWEKRGIKGPKPTFLVGNLGKAFLLKAQPGEIYADIYRIYKDEPVVGLFRSFTPLLLVRDPEIIKELVTRSFSNFHDNDIFLDQKADPLLGKNPFFLKGEEWKRTRSKITPAFTTGKMKWLYPYLESNGEGLVQFVQRKSKSDPFEAKDLCSRFTMNNVGDCVFGIEAKCFQEGTTEFTQLGKDLLSPGSWAMIAITLSVIVPSIMKLLSVKITSKHVEEKLRLLTQESLSFREKNKIVRNDMLEILSQLKKNTTDGSFTDLDVVAQAMTFFGDGYETSAMAMSFVLFQLASNPKAQTELRREVRKAFEENHNLPYEVLQNLPYLDAVVCETLRIHPPATFLPKLCTESYNLVLKEKNISLNIEKGTPIVLSLWGLHTDPKYFDEPDKFKPERFLGENKENIKKGTYMPFGEGPRSCLGQRFGLLQVKTGVAYMVNSFEMTVNKKTQLPLKFDPTSIFFTPIGGLWLDFKTIEK